MKTIIAELNPNNQVTLRYVNRPNCLKGKAKGDLSNQVEIRKIAEAQHRLEKMRAKLVEGERGRPYPNFVYGDKTAGMQEVKSATACVDKDMSGYLGTENYLACDIEYEIEKSDKIWFEGNKCTRRELEQAASLLLDIIKKSQQVRKKERPWGKVQTVKKFTRNAKQKILEAGAVVDKHCDADSRYELTLTIPGSGVDVYDAVARYSGYIVNRMTQTIRRLEAKGLHILWFFVWEHQKRGALHMHWCISIPGEPMLADWLCRRLRGKWFDLLEELSVKTGIDLFKKRGFSGTWRHTPKAWQSNIAVVRKSVAAYFSKYLSKNCETTRFNRDRTNRQEALRKKYPHRLEYCRVISLCPSRYWGCGSGVRALCKRYRVNLSFGVSSAKEGNFVASIVSKWLGEISDKCTEVSRTFKKVDVDTGFIYCSGWESKIWFEASVMDDVLRLFKRLRANQERKKDAIGAIVDMDNF